MSFKIARYKCLILLLLPFTFILTKIASYFPNRVENIYAQHIYPAISHILTFLTGWISFSTMEGLFLILIFIILYLTFKHIRLFFIKKSQRMHLLYQCFIHILMIISLIYFMFIGLWGMNYYRLDFSQIAHMSIQKSSSEELYNLCEFLIQNANKLRMKLNEDALGIMIIDKGYEDVFERANIGYLKLAQQYPVFKPFSSTPKPIAFSNLLSYTGISGIYSPFTGEANVNISIPDVFIPSTACHEMAHQRGFAREDEANYLAYLACMAHKDLDFQYSGTMLALIHSMNTLFDIDQNKFIKLHSQYSKGVLRDLKDVHQFWKNHEGTIEKTTSKINDTYLKSNGQRDGTKSYGRMVDLLLANFRQNVK